MKKRRQNKNKIQNKKHDSRSTSNLLLSCQTLYVSQGLFMFNALLILVRNVDHHRLNSSFHC